MKIYQCKYTLSEEDNNIIEKEDVRVNILSEIEKKKRSHFDRFDHSIVEIEYTKDCWNDLFTFINNGFVEMTNNTAERPVKPFVVQRKLFQTSGFYTGARYTGKILSIIQTCLINNVKVEKYLEYVLNNLNRKPIEELLPYSKNIKDIK